MSISDAFIDAAAAEPGHKRSVRRRVRIVLQICFALIVMANLMMGADGHSRYQSAQLPGQGAVPTGVDRLADFVSHSNVIVAGHVSGFVAPAMRSPIPGAVQFQVDVTVFGAAQPNVITIKTNFDLPIAVTPGTYCIAFLNQTESGLWFTNPFLPFFPAEQGTVGPSTQPLNQIEKDIIDVVAAPNVSPVVAQLGIGLLRMDGSDASTVALRGQIGSRFAEVKLAAIDALLVRGDAAGWNAAMEIIGTPNEPDNVRRFFNTSIEFSANSAQLANYAALVTDRDPSIRLAAMSAVGQIAGDQDVLPILAKGLYDDNVAIRQSAIQGLARYTGQRSLGVGNLRDGSYASREGALLDYWRQWASRHAGGGGI